MKANQLIIDLTKAFELARTELISEADITNGDFRLYITLETRMDSAKAPKLRVQFSHSHYQTLFSQVEAKGIDFYETFQELVRQVKRDQKLKLLVKAEEPEY